VPRIPPQILIHNTDIQPRWFKEDISFHPLNSKGERIMAPIICSREIIKNLNLKVEVLNLNVLELPVKLGANLIIARAFKPLKIILRFLDKNTVNWKRVFLFLGKTGQVELLQASKRWDIKYKQRMSITSSDSIVLEINKLKKK